MVVAGHGPTGLSLPFLTFTTTATCSSSAANRAFRLLRSLACGGLMGLSKVVGFLTRLGYRSPLGPTLYAASRPVMGTLLEC